MSSAQTLLAEQFHDLNQQREVASTGMWVFLMTELLLFGALFVAYTVFRHLYHGGFVEGCHHMETGIGTINTAILIGSGFMMATAVRGSQTGSRWRLLSGLWMTIILGVVFLALKFLEYYHHYRDGLTPGVNFHLAGEQPTQVELFFYLYYVMTGLHALHMMIGLGVVAVMLGLAYRGKFSPQYHSPVEVAGLYWHFVDIVWIFLYPTFYLINPK